MERNDQQLRRAMAMAALSGARQRATRRIDPDTGLIHINPTISPEHYHIVYNIPKENLSIPRFSERFDIIKPAYQAIFDLAKEAEPNVEYYNDGTIGLEMRMKGRTGTMWVVLEVGVCLRANCPNT